MREQLARLLTVCPAPPRPPAVALEATGSATLGARLAAVAVVCGLFLVFGCGFVLGAVARRPAAEVLAEKSAAAVLQRASASPVSKRAGPVTPSARGSQATEDAA